LFINTISQNHAKRASHTKIKQLLQHEQHRQLLQDSEEGIVKYTQWYLSKNAGVITYYKKNEKAKENLYKS
jgi:hypothetical protein